MRTLRAITSGISTQTYAKQILAHHEQNEIPATAEELVEVRRIAAKPRGSDSDSDRICIESFDARLSAASWDNVVRHADEIVDDASDTEKLVKKAIEAWWIAGWKRDGEQWIKVAPMSHTQRRAQFFLDCNRWGDMPPLSVQEISELLRIVAEPRKGDAKYLVRTFAARFKAMGCDEDVYTALEIYEEDDEEVAVAIAAATKAWAKTGWRRCGYGDDASEPRWTKIEVSVNNETK
jgi:hypothetical protein